MAQEPQTKPRSNESTTPTLNPPRVDRAPVRRGPGLFALALGAWGFGRSNPPDHCPWRDGHTAGWAIHCVGLRTKLPPNEFTRLILKARGPRRGALG